MAVLETLENLGHATNLDIWETVRKSYPEVSVTTIHRVTTRLNTQGKIGCAPKSANGSERYDITPTQHHHFICDMCGMICDVPETPEARQFIEQLGKLSGACALAEALTLSGTCKSCKQKERNNV